MLIGWDNKIATFNRRHYHQYQLSIPFKFTWLSFCFSLFCIFYLLIILMKISDSIFSINVTYKIYIFATMSESRWSSLCSWWMFALVLNTFWRAVLMEFWSVIASSHVYICTYTYTYTYLTCYNHTHTKENRKLKIQKTVRIVIQGRTNRTKILLFQSFKYLLR